MLNGINHHKSDVLSTPLATVTPSSSFPPPGLFTSKPRIKQPPSSTSRLNRQLIPIIAKADLEVRRRGRIQLAIMRIIQTILLDDFELAGGPVRREGDAAAGRGAHEGDAAAVGPFVAVAGGQRDGFEDAEFADDHVAVGERGGEALEGRDRED